MYTTKEIEEIIAAAVLDGRRFEREEWILRIEEKIKEIDHKTPTLITSNLLSPETVLELIKVNALIIDALKSLIKKEETK
jgi:hypothetical protein